MIDSSTQNKIYFFLILAPVPHILFKALFSLFGNLIVPPVAALTGLIICGQAVVLLQPPQHRDVYKRQP